MIIRSAGTEYIIGRTSHYTGLFICYDCKPTLSEAIKAAKLIDNRKPILFNI